MTAIQLSALCSNLARGCEKQYRQKEADGFTKLADYFKKHAGTVSADDRKLAELIEQDLSRRFPDAFETVRKAGDRGALRALTWSEKVTKMQQSLLARYEKMGDAMFENTGVYVCTVCGFIWIGAEPPALCPVCKVPGWKFEKVERRA